jgi:hypothetical protein
VTATILSVLGAVDCEAFREGSVGQPANELSSFAYVLVGIWIIAMTRVHRGWRTHSLVFAGCILAAGLGSVALHGPRPTGTQLLHDVPIALTLGLLVLHDLALIIPYDKWLRVFAWGGVVVAGAALVVPEVAAVVAAAMVPVLVVEEVLVYRRGLRSQPRRHQAHLLWAISGVAALAAGLWVVGRDGSPYCDPTSLFQAHAAWHVASAIAFGIWWWLALAADPTSADVEGQTQQA